jgi:hypothetical protein
VVEDGVFLLVWRQERGKARRTGGIKLCGRRDFMDPVVSPESANGGHMTVEVKCEIHVAMTNGLSLDDVLFYR